MNDEQWAALRKLQCDTATLLSESAALIRSFACKRCGGTGQVDLSREPCSTATYDCPTCDGKGYDKQHKDKNTTVEQPKMSLEYVGSVFTDVAALLIADPCKTLADDGKNPPTYEDLLDKWNASAPPLPSLDDMLQGVRQPIIPTSPIVKLLDDVAVIRFGTDGYCHIYVERDENGVKTVIIKPGMCTKEPK